MTKHITAETLKEAIANNRYATGAAASLGIRYDTFKRKCAIHGLQPLKNPSHRGEHIDNGRTISLEDIFANKVWTKAGNIKQKMLDAGLIKNECQDCGIGPTWMGKPLTLQLDHIDGDCKNNSRSNLRLLCPNCHTQTSTWGRKIRNASVL